MANSTRILIYTLALAGLSVGPLHGQYAEYMRSGRPGQAIGTYTVGANTLQGQHGVTLRSVEAGSNTTRTVTVGSVLRLGLTEDFEVSGVLRYQRDATPNDGDVPNPLNRSGLSSTQLGVRYNVTSESAKVPSICVQTRLLLNAVGEDYQRTGVGQTTLVAVGKGISDRLGLTANVGFTNGGQAPGLTSFYALSVGFNASQRLSFFVEGYGRLDDVDINFDAGLGYFLSPDLKLDFSAGLEGFGGFEGDPVGLDADYFLDLGISWRVNWRAE